MVAAAAAFREDIDRMASASVAFPVGRNTAAEVVAAAAVVVVENVVAAELVVVEQTAAAEELAVAAAADTVEEESWVGPWLASAVPVEAVRP